MALRVRTAQRRKRRYLVHASLISVFAVVGVCKDNAGTPLDSIDPMDPVDPCLQAPADCEPSESVIDSFPVPLVDGGGLYGERSNRPPEFHVEAGIRAGSQVPLSGAVLAAIGMSNTSLEFGAFKKLASGSTDAVVATTACWACTVAVWDTPSGRGWTKANNWLASHGYAPEDVDVVWLKATRQKDQSVTADDLERILVVLRAKWPNTRQVFVSDRIYVGYLSAGAEPASNLVSSASAGLCRRCKWQATPRERQSP